MRRAAAGAAALVVLLLLVCAPGAGAHAVLVSSDPVDGARLSSAPAAVTLTFDEAVRLVPDGVAVISATDGTRVSTAATLSNGGSTVVLALRANLARGSYTATWRVISADTHEVTGSISFGVGQDPQAPPPVHDSASPALIAAAAVARGSLYVGLVLALGMSFAAVAVWPGARRSRRTRWTIRAGVVLVIAASAAEFLLVTARDAGTGWKSALDVAELTSTAGTRSGMLIGARIIAVLVIAGLTETGAKAGPPQQVSRPWAVVAGVAAIGLAMTVAADGHAGAGVHSGLATVVTTAHLVAMSVWLGGLLLLLITPPEDRLDHWSAIAATAVVVVLVSGVFQAWRQVTPLASLWSTGYGITLCAKLAVVIAMLAVAYAARRHLGSRPLRRPVAMEAALGAMVIAVTTVLVSQAPARTTYGPPVSATAGLDDGRAARVRISSTRRGPTTVETTVVGPHDEALRPQSVTGTLSSQDAGVPALTVRFTDDAQGHWHSTYATLPRPGHWLLRLTVQFSQSDAVVTAVPFQAW